MVRLLQSLRGDKAIWGILALLALFSFLPVYSAAASHVFNGGKSFAFLMSKQMALWVLGFAIVYVVHRTPTHYFKGLSLIAMPIVLVLLAYTLTIETNIGGASANRWIPLAFGVRFQTSTLAAVVLMVWIARYLTKIRDKEVTFNESFLPLWMPIILVVGLILPANFSTAAIVGCLAFLLCFLGGYPLKYLLRISGAGLLVIGLFFTVLFTKPELIPTSRSVTWKNRIENFLDKKDTPLDEKKELEQVDYAKMAIAEGGIIGKGAGKSVMKNVLPESDSDFIFAIILEEYGLIGGLALLFFYLLLLFRIVVVANSAKTVFSKLVVIGVGLPIVIQAFVHMAVAVGLFPTTGQPLPLISRGGTSIWMTCAAIGIILSASDKKQDETAAVDESNPLEVLSGQL